MVCCFIVDVERITSPASPGSVTPSDCFCSRSTAVCASGVASFRVDTAGAADTSFSECDSASTGVVSWKTPVVAELESGVSNVILL